MKKNNSTKRGPQDGNHQSAPPEKVGWVRKFCGKGIFREIWKNRYVVLKGDQLYISEKEASPDIGCAFISSLWTVKGHRDGLTSE
nr:pleckstrin homology domain-containing family O member 1-like isoform X1 [Loxodonta africana]